MENKDTVTLEEILTQKYTNLFEDVKNITGDLEIFFEQEKNDNIDLLELTDLILFLFPDTNTLYNINELLELKKINTITEEQKTKLVPIIDNFLIFLNKVKNVM